MYVFMWCFGVQGLHNKCAGVWWGRAVGPWCRCYMAWDDFVCLGHLWHHIHTPSPSMSTTPPAKTWYIIPGLIRLSFNPSTRCACARHARPTRTRSSRARWASSLERVTAQLALGTSPPYRPGFLQNARLTVDALHACARVRRRIYLATASAGVPQPLRRRGDGAAGGHAATPNAHRRTPCRTVGSRALVGYCAATPAVGHISHPVSLPRAQARRRGQSPTAAATLLSILSVVGTVRVGVAAATLGSARWRCPLARLGRSFRPRRRDASRPCSDGALVPRGDATAREHARAVGIRRRG